MGILRLYEFLRKSHSSCLKQVSMNQLAGTTVAVDASVLMYQFIVKMISMP